MVNQNIAITPANASLNNLALRRPKILNSNGKLTNYKPSVKRKGY
jgi:hypothetical protein